MYLFWIVDAVDSKVFKLFSKDLYGFFFLQRKTTYRLRISLKETVGKLRKQQRRRWVCFQHVYKYTIVNILTCIKNTWRKNESRKLCFFFALVSILQKTSGLFNGTGVDRCFRHVLQNVDLVSDIAFMEGEKCFEWCEWLIFNLFELKTPMSI